MHTQTLEGGPYQPDASPHPPTLCTGLNYLLLVVVMLQWSRPGHVPNDVGIMAYTVLYTCFSALHSSTLGIQHAITIGDHALINYTVDVFHRKIKGWVNTNLNGNTWEEHWPQVYFIGPCAMGP